MFFHVHLLKNPKSVEFKITMSFLTYYSVRFNRDGPLLIKSLLKLYISHSYINLQVFIFICKSLYDLFATTKNTH